MAEHDRTARPDNLAKHTPAVHREVPAFHPRHRLNLARPVPTPTRQSCICATRDRLPRGSSNTRPCRTYPAASKAPVATRTHARVGDLPLPQAPRRWGRGRRHAVGRPLCATSGHAGQSIGMHASNARHSARADGIQVGRMCRTCATKREQRRPVSSEDRLGSACCVPCRSGTSWPTEHPCGPAMPRTAATSATDRAPPDPPR